MKNLFITTLLLLTLSACMSQKETTYLQDVYTPYYTPIAQSANVTIKNGDWLSIIVNSRDVDITRMLNLPMVSNLGGNSTNNATRIVGYLVDDEGFIDFPQYGMINAKGLTLIELSNAIKRGLIEKGLVNDAVVTVQFLNYTVSVTGEVNKPGNYSSPTGRISILDALSMAGDLTIYGRRDNVMVIREEEGVRSITHLDLRTKNIFDSPFFYLHQNDVVYVEPNSTKAGQREINQNTSIGTYASLVSVLISLSVLLFK